MACQSIFQLSITTPTVQRTHPKTTFSGFCTSEAKKQIKLGSGLACKAISNHRIQDYADTLQSDFRSITWTENVDHTLLEEELKISIPEEIINRVNIVRSMLRSMGDGDISISAYDTAWVALVRDIHGSDSPQFPSSIEWIVENQFPDGSWGDGKLFSPHDRIINTLACVTALKSWNIHPQKREKGLLFLRENLNKLEEEDEEHMPIGFEIVFPSLIEIARGFGIEFPDDHDAPVIKNIYAKRNLKISKIPKDIMHKVPTTILHSLEGMSKGLDWEKLLKLQCSDGSFLFSPASTAFALMQTKDEKCLAYLNKAVARFNGGVPNVYPVDLFEHLWAVDRLQRLGISRYFRSEIKECMDYVKRYWGDRGICWARKTNVQDMDDTAMGFRLLRLHGHDVSADVFRNFRKDGGEFCCFAGQSTEAVTGMYNLYRATQLKFPGEKILQEAEDFSSEFLRKKQAANELLDKWIITKDLPGEVEYALDVPWYASLPRVETRLYIQQYGGEDDVWIGKTLYRMHCVNNNTYLELAKLDYNNCQAFHQLEWDSVQKWNTGRNFGSFGVSRRRLLNAYFVAVASIYEPERTSERLAWTKTVVLVEAISSFFKNQVSENQRSAFVHEFIQSGSHKNHVNNGRCQPLITALIETINHLSLDALVLHGGDIRQQLFHAWENWLMGWKDEGDRYKGEAELIVRTIELNGGRWVRSENEYNKLIQLTNSVCDQISHIQTQKVDVSNGSITMHKLETEMQELVKKVLSNSSDGIARDTKETCLAVAKGFYYGAYCNQETINSHISKVLFDRIL